MSFAASWPAWADEDAWTITDDEPTGPIEEDEVWWSEQTRDDGDWTDSPDADAIAEEMADDAAALDAHERGIKMC